VARNRGRSLLDAVEISASLVLVLFAFFYLNLFLGGRLNGLGVVPRTGRGLLGIIFSPLLHYNSAHLTTNAVSLFLLLVILFRHREYQPERTLATLWFWTGLGTWLIGRPWGLAGGGPVTVHIGASGVIYGLVTYLIAAAWWLRTWSSAGWALLILFLYGGIFYGALPHPGLISWEGHLSGVVAGLLVARKQHK
jgi:membrane associated rhomboid family serine protease